MKKARNSGASESVKAIARAGVEHGEENKRSMQDAASPDAFLAEKDELKKAEEKLRNNKSPKK